MNYSEKKDPKSQKNFYEINYNHLNEWKRTKIDIGVIGDSAYGLKQFFINRLTGYGPMSTYYDLKVDVYNHKNNSNLKIWDLSPHTDINSLNFLNFISSININKFDLFILFRTRNFNDFDQKICDFFKSKEKRLFLVGIKQDFELSISPQITQNIYIISTDDFSKLNEDIIENLEYNKMTAFVLSLDPISAEIIEKKSEVLKKRSSGVSIQSSIFGTLISGPGLTIIADIALLSAEIWFYRKQLGLTNENFKKLSENSHSAWNKILQDLSTNRYGSYALLRNINQISCALIKMIPSILVSDFVEIIKLIPMVGSILHGSTSMAVSKSTLLQIIDELSRVAIRIQNLARNN